MCACAILFLEAQLRLVTVHFVGQRCEVLVQVLDVLHAGSTYDDVGPVVQRASSCSIQNLVYKVVDLRCDGDLLKRELQFDVFILLSSP